MGKKGSKLPRTVKGLDKSRKEWAKKNGLDYKDSAGNKKLAKKEFAESFLEGLDRAMEIIISSPNDETSEKVKKKIEEALGRPKRMAEAAELYKKNRKKYDYVIYLPNVIVRTLQYLHSGASELTSREKEIAAKIDEAALTDFCETVLKKPYEHYRTYGLSPSAAMSLASAVPSAKILNKGYWYRVLCQTFYSMAETDDFEIESMFKAIATVDKRDVIRKREIRKKFWLEFILMKNSNRFKQFNDSQKNFHEHLQTEALKYMNGLSEDELEAMLYKYIKRRKESESSNTDGRRIFRFTDHANSNSPYTNIKKVVEKIISARPESEAYLK